MMESHLAQVAVLIWLVIFPDGFIYILDLSFLECYTGEDRHDRLGHGERIGSAAVCVSRCVPLIHDAVVLQDEEGNCLRLCERALQRIRQLHCVIGRRFWEWLI